MNTERTDPSIEAVQRLLDGYPGPEGRLRHRHWTGLVTIALTIGAVGLAVPRLLGGPPTAMPPDWRMAPPASNTAVSAPAVPPTSSSTRSSPTDPQRTTAAPRPVRSTAPVSAPVPASASAPSRSTAPAPRFQPVVAQAENGRLSDGASATDCAACSAGQRVRYLGRVEVGVKVAAAGQRTVTVAYTVDGTRWLSLAINGAVVLSRRLVSGSSWGEPQRVSVRTAVPAGAVTIAVYGANEAPDVDSITITR